MALSPTSSRAVAPTGAAGGDLTGTYPNPTVAPGLTLTQTADAVVFTAKASAGQTAEIVKFANSGGRSLFGVYPNGHGIYLDRNAGAANDYATTIYLKYDGTPLWNFGLSQEHVLWAINNNTSGADVVTINVHDQVAITGGTMTSETDHGTRLIVAGDGLARTLQLTALTLDSSHSFFDARKSFDNNPVLSLDTTGNFHAGPGGATVPDLTYGRTGAGQFTSQPTTDNTSAFRVLNQSAGSSVLRVDTTNGLVFVKNLVGTIAVDPGAGNLSASQFTLWLDATNSAARLNIRAKTADGTSVTGQVALS